jgi:hypothetical protein
MSNSLTKHILTYIVFRMKTRIALYLLSLATLGFLRHAIFSPATTVAENTAAVATVNGGDAAFVAQQALHATTGFPFTLIAFLVITALFWASPFNKFINSETK